MEFAELEVAVRELQAALEALLERMDRLEQSVDAELETLQLQINNLRN